MFNKISLKFFLLCGAMLMTGCATEFNTATQRQESLMYGDEKEHSIGAGVALQVEKQMKFNYEVDVNERVEKIFKRIVDVCERKDLVFTIRVIDEDEVNAFSLPGGYVYLFKGLIDRVKSDDELASVIAHEVAHIAAKHSIKRIQEAYGATVLETAAIASGNYNLAAGVNMTAASVFFANSRDHEFEADKLGVNYLKRAGYDASAMRTMLGRLLEYQSKLPASPKSYWRTHPYIPQRMARANAHAKGGAEFRDFLNITGEER